MPNQPAAHNAFQFLRQQTINALQLNAQLFQHKETGAVHLHLDTGQKENVFLVAFRTMPKDSTGVAHILEHTALCGSNKFPVRDPFFMMIRRSLNTYMNALTSSDWTAYPLASQNQKDFFNLMEVYLDAAFFANLDELDFAQEGHRLELEKQTDASEKLIIKGVVYNEMKGSMSSPISQLLQNVSKHLFPTTTYHFNSGGEPMEIPQLSYQQLLDFHKSHYHPSNAIFFTSGNIAAAKMQEKMHDFALSQFQAQSMNHLYVKDELRYFSPLRVQEGYALAEEDTRNKTHHVMAWLFGSSIDLSQQMQANLLSRILLDNSASPLRKLLETCGIGCAPSPILGLDSSSREMVFVCGIEGAEPDQVEAFEELVLQCLQTLVEQGIPQEQVDAALHQLELRQREIGDDYPFGLQLAFTALPSLVHHGDALSALNLDPVIEQLRQDVQQADYITNLIRQQLLENPHRITYSMVPDKHLDKNRQLYQDQWLAKRLSNMPEIEKQQLRDKTLALQEHQNSADDVNILPRVGREDIPADMLVQEPSSKPGDSITYYTAATNGLVYHQLMMPWPQVDEEGIRYLSLLAYMLTELGLGSRDYLAIQARQGSVCGLLSAHLSKRGAVDNADVITGYFVLSIQGLLSKQDEIAQLLKDTLTECCFGEHQRIRDLVSQLRMSRQHRLADGGTGLALACASQSISAAGNINYIQSGLVAIKWLQDLDDSLADDQNLATFCWRLQQLHQSLVLAPKQLVCVSEAEPQEALIAKMAETFAGEIGIFPAQVHWQYQQQPIKQIWTVNTQVNFCGRCYATVPSAHADSAALVLLGEILQNGILHRTLREQGGAYGGGASQDNNSACFRFYSYRDPRSAETYADFAQAIGWAIQDNITPEHLQEAVLKIIGGMDKPHSPTGEAISAYNNLMFGRTPAICRAYRQRILAVESQDILRVAKTYLVDQAYHDVVVGPEDLAGNKYFSDFEVFTI